MVRRVLKSSTQKLLSKLHLKSGIQGIEICFVYILKERFQLYMYVQKRLPQNYACKKVMNPRMKDYYSQLTGS